MKQTKETNNTTPCICDDDDNKKGSPLIKVCGKQIISHEYVSGDDSKKETPLINTVVEKKSISLTLEEYEIITMAINSQEVRYHKIIKARGNIESPGYKKELGQHRKLWVKMYDKKKGFKAY